MLTSVRQSIVQTPMHDTDATFTQAVWVGTAGGSALPADPSPNVTPPSVGRIVKAGPRGGSTSFIGLGPVLRILCGVIVGSSVTVQTWFFDETQAQWISFGVPVAITPTGAASNLRIDSQGGVWAGSKWFVQITANTLVRELGYDFI